MINQTDLSGKFAFDTKGLDQLKTAARRDSPEALKGTAQQFEALFLNMVMKSMREATPKEGPFSSEQEKMLTGMLDQQLTQTMAKRGVGLADKLVLQLSKNLSRPPIDPALKGNVSAAEANVSGQSGLVANIWGNHPANLAANGTNGANGAANGTANGVTSGAVNGIANVATNGAVQPANRVAATPATTTTPATAKAGASTVPATENISRIEALSRELASDPTTRAFLPGRLGNSSHLYLNNEQLDKVARALPGGNAVPALDTRLASGKTRGQPEHVRHFQQRLAGHAEEASRETGIPAKFMLGQAALESGWGRREIVAADGQKSHNLFGIKATPGWKGKTAEAVTTEYVNGVAHTRREKFRVYDSYADGFRDYARLLSKNPRYEGVIAGAQDANSFARGLQRAGYATDPNYANKLSRIINQSLI